MWREEFGKRRTLAFFLEREFALFVVVLVLAATPVFTSLWSSVSVTALARLQSFARRRFGLTFPLFLGMMH